MPCFTYYSWRKPHIVLQLLRKADSGVTTCHGLFAQSHSWKQSQREAKVGMVPAPPPAVSPPTLAPPPSGWCCSRKSGTGELLEGHSPSLPLGHAVSHSPLPAPLPLLHSDIQSSIEKPQHPVGRTLALDSQRSGFSPDSAGDRLYYLKLVIAPLSFSVLICKRAVMNSIYVRVTGAHACDFISTEPRTL